MRFFALNFLTQKGYFSGSGCKITRYQVKERGLTRSVRPDYRLDDTFLHGKIDIIHGTQTTKLFIDGLQFKHCSSLTGKGEPFPEYSKFRPGQRA